ncbi:MAG: molybdopterin-dependent oxidoreductase [Microbacterium sp.]|uniref:molybdopterin-dependent oxidoreductase n=1 Tax=Microbacterium sp. TaxID=51671 RepID=UPI0026277413|nr:molybdopterin-dependent oxidoreductase [Microbacterium sp.]MCX6502605.1 molybdopterin-dependent oxidoreductase [Microbacterium sp.]
MSPRAYDVGELVAAVTGTSPVSAVGAAAIDLAPAWAKDTAIALFGTADKIALIIGVIVVLLTVAIGAGLLERRVPPWGRTLLALLGLVGVAAAVTRADAGMLSWLAPLAAAAAAMFALALLLRRAPAASEPAVSEHAVSEPAVSEPAVSEFRLSDPDSASAGPDPRLRLNSDTQPDRRTFLVWTGVAAGIGVLAALGGTALRAGSQAVATIRDTLRLPAATNAVTVPAGAELDVPGLSPLLTPNADFYRIDTALSVPQIDPATWSLRIHGLVAQEVTLSWDELLALPLEESITTLACVSNEVGGDLIGTAAWLGYPIRELLARAAPDADADMVLSTSQDGFTAGTPLEALSDERNAILAVGMNGEPLPLAHGFPVRMVVPGLYGYVSATKWVVDLEVTRFADARAYWTDRGWSERGPIKLESRIDVPRRGANVAAGDTVIAGVAWQQHLGVAGVEVQIDDGVWLQATLATAISDDTWVQWMLPWRAASGSHTIRCRATNTDGDTQTAALAPPAPDGATGWHTIQVSVG